MKEDRALCFQCHKANKTFLKYLEDALETDKVFIGFYTSSRILQFQVSKSVTHGEMLFIVDALIKYKDEF